MTWVDGDRWDSERGKRLLDLLVEQYNLDGLITQLLHNAGLGLGKYVTSGTLEVRWMEMTRQIHGIRGLGLLIDQVARDHPQLAGQLHELSADPAPVAANPANDPYQVLVLALGRRPFIGRGNLRVKLKEFLEQESGVMIIRGDTTGKSYSYELVQHVVKTIPGLLLHDVRFEVAHGNGAEQLMSRLFQRVTGNELPVTEGQTTTSTKNAAELVNVLVSKYCDDGKRRLLFIDGLDRKDLKPDVYEMVAELIAETVRRQLPATQVILAGYSGEYDREYEYGMVLDDVEAILQRDLEDYFQRLALGRELTTDELAGLVQRSLSGDTAVKALADRVRNETLQLLAPAGGPR